MTKRITDPDLRIIASIAAALKRDYEDPAREDLWAGRPFHWTRGHLSRQPGKAAERFIVGWCAAKGLNVMTSEDGEADRVIEGCRVQIKFSTLEENGTYTFRQIPDQRYSYVICLGLSPFEEHCWVVPKEVLMQHARPQHGGADGRDTYWISFPASEPPAWLADWGGSLSEAFQILKGFGSS